MANEKNLGFTVDPVSGQMIPAQPQAHPPPTSKLIKINSGGTKIELPVDEGGARPPNVQTTPNEGQAIPEPEFSPQPAQPEQIAQARIDEAGRGTVDIEFDPAGFQVAGSGRPAEVGEAERVIAENTKFLEGLAVSAASAPQPEVQEQQAQEVQAGVTPEQESVPGDESFARAIEGIGAAQQEQTGIASEAAEARQGFVQQTADEAQKNIQEETTARNAALLQSEARIQEIDKAIEVASQMKLDPARFWNQDGDFHKLAGLAAAFIGGFLQPVLGVNNIQPLIDNAIDRDIDAQKQAITGKQQGIQNLRILHDLGLQQSRSGEESRNIQRLMRYDSIVRSMNAKLAEFDSPSIKAAGQETIERLQLKMAEIRQAIKDGNFEKSQAIIKNELDQQRIGIAKGQLGVSRGNLNVSRAREERAGKEFDQTLGQRQFEFDTKTDLAREKLEAGEKAARAKLQGKARENFVRGVDIGLGTRANGKFQSGVAGVSGDERAKLVDTAAGAQQTYTGLDAVDQFIQQAAVGTINLKTNDGRARFAALVSKITAEAVEQLVKGAASDKDVERIEKAFTGGDVDVFVKLIDDQTIQTIVRDRKREIINDTNTKTSQFENANTGDIVWRPAAVPAFDFGEGDKVDRVEGLRAMQVVGGTETSDLRELDGEVAKQVKTIAFSEIEKAFRFGEEKQIRSRLDQIKRARDKLREAAKVGVPGEGGPSAPKEGETVKFRSKEDTRAMLIAIGELDRAITEAERKLSAGEFGDVSERIGRGTTAPSTGAGTGTAPLPK